MKPVVSSLVALAIAIAPLAATAKIAEKSAHHGKATSTKVVKHKGRKSEKIAKSERIEKIERIERIERTEKPAKVEKLARVKHAKKATVHHAHGVDVGGGHAEPRIERGVSVVPASLMTKVTATVHTKPAKATKAANVTKVAKLTRVSAVSKTNEMPQLPPPNAHRPGAKNAAEKGARKPAEKKHEESSANDGKPARDESFAELVARIRGPKSARPAEAGAESPKAKQVAAKPCLKDPVEIIRGPEIQKLSLTTCDGSIAPLAIEQVSILIRPGSAPRPTTPIAELAKKKDKELAHGIRRVDPRLVARLQSVVDHFGKSSGGLPKLSIISGYRPTSVGSMHQTGRAVDFRLEGVKNEEVVAFCKTLDDTGCGFYPNSSFVHVDVRDHGAGHVSWIDASGPGESPRYVSTWPPPEPSKSKKDEREEDAIKKPADVLEHTSARTTEPASPLDRTAVPEPVDEHPSEVSEAAAEPAEAKAEKPEKADAKPDSADEEDDP